MVDMRAVERLAAKQHGCFNTTQTQSAGFSDKAVSRRLASGEWVAMTKGVYAISSAPATWERQLSAAILSRNRAIAAGASAAHLHGFTGFGPQRPVIMVPWSASARSSLATVIRSQWFTTLPRAFIRGFELTSAAETVVTLAAYLPKSRIVRIFEDGLAANRFGITDVAEILERVDGARVRGIRIIRQLHALHIPDAPEKGATYLERLLEMLLAEPVLPPSTREFAFHLDSAPARVDAYIPEWEIVIEADGRNEHSRRAAFVVDRRRDNELAARGILVMRFSYDDLKNHRDECLRVVVEAGRHRSLARATG